MQTLQEYLVQWDERNRIAHRSIALFDPEKTSRWSQSQKVTFAKLFYHARGHFYDFLWYMGNFAPNIVQRKKIIANITEEFGSAKSHEQLYVDFASAVGADLSQEIVDNQSYTPFLRDFNKGHLEYLHSHDWNGRLCAFAAYERLDNVDYEDLYVLAKSICSNEPALFFFKVHALVKHFDMVDQGDLEKIWETEPDALKEAFEFISEHQIGMWRSLSSAIEQLRTVV